MFKRIIISTVTRACIIILSAAFLFPLSASAQQELSLSVVPPFFQMTVTPGESWSSFIKVVNVNNYPITLYAFVVNFDANDNENGKGKFTPLLSQDPIYKEASLAGWIDVTSEPIHIEAGQTVRVPFSINTPDSASPGGHYAAILIGNQPSKEEVGGAAIGVSTLISSLIFARVAGDIDERGDIREFSTDSIFYETPEVSFAMRFQNSGNVHLLPQGDITIYNMWGRERGVIPINQKTAYGNVLPHSTRKFQFEWEGDASPFEIGRYTAISTVSFGQSERQNVMSKTSFWVVPIVPVLSVLGVLIIIILLISWFIRRYIRKALGNEAAILGVSVKYGSKNARKDIVHPKILTKPIVDGVMDLRNVRLDTHEHKKGISPVHFIKRYRFFFYFLILLIISIMVGTYFFGEVLKNERDYKVRVDSDISVPFSSE